MRTLINSRESFIEPKQEKKENCALYWITAILILFSVWFNFAFMILTDRKVS